MTQQMPLIATLAAGFVLAFLLGALAHGLKVSPIIGYLAAGIVVGPYTPGFVADIGLVKQLAEMGVILLMFGVGLHFSVSDMATVSHISLPGAAAQMTIITGLGWCLAYLMGWPPVGGLVFGFTLSVASTVVLLRALEEHKLLQTRRGQIAIGWLIVQDIAMIVALVLLPMLAELLRVSGETYAAGGHMLVTFGMTLAKIGAFAAVMLIIGRKIIPWVLERIAMTGSRELFTLALLAIALGIAVAAAELAGASLALGAFFAGMVLAGSELSQNAAERSLPLRDAFAVLFFVSVGMLFNPLILLENPLSLLAIVLIIVVGNALAAFGIMRLFGYSGAVAALIGVSLAQIGEFSFLLGGLALSLDILPKEAYDLLLGGAIVSIMINPVMFRLSERVEERLIGDGGDAGEAVEDAPQTPGAFDLRNHIIIVGYGRVGRHLSGFLVAARSPFVVIEPQKDRIDLMKRHQVRALYGQAAEADVLRAAGIARARALLVAIPNAYDAVLVVNAARKLSPKLRIIARAQFEAEAEYLRANGVQTSLLAERELARNMISLVDGDLVRSSLIERQSHS
jgi:CPA2 family monovalent cation:H+ antiporter-2